FGICATRRKALRFQAAVTVSKCFAPCTFVRNATSSSARATASSQRSKLPAVSICSPSSLARFSSSPVSFISPGAGGLLFGDPGVCPDTDEAIERTITVSNDALIFLTMTCLLMCGQPNCLLTFRHDNRAFNAGQKRETCQEIA